MTVVTTDDPVALYKINKRYENIKLHIRCTTVKVDITN